MAININIPSQVVNYANLAAFPASGSLKTIYIAEDTNKTYRWTGSVYVEISATAASTWGAITGTLSSQTDLQTALNGKVPTSRTLTINGTTQDLSADRTFTISTGITIGTTAITSGTVGRVLFEGTGNVVSESANLFWDSTNNRLGVGTSSPAQTFQVYRNTSAGYLASFNSGATLNTNASLTVRIENANLPSLQALNAGAGAFNTFALNPLGGNILIGTTTDAGFKLDVNGTARVSGNITQSGANTSNLGYIVNTGVLGSASNLPSASSLALVIGCVSNSGHTATFTKGNNPNSTAIRITDQNVGLSVNHFLVDYVGASGFGIANGTLQVNASAQVEIQSTTKGFLPPRMTTTQKNAIATPAAGLQVYDSTLNRPCFYDGTTWITL
jgi:hypothetical protein